MLYKGPSGLWGAPEENPEDYEVMSVFSDPEIKCYVHKDVLEYISKNQPTPERDYLFSVEGVGRLRFKIVN